MGGMAKRTPPKLVTIIHHHFGDLEDPRIERTRAHPLINVLVMALGGVLAGASGWDPLEVFARTHKKFFEQILEMPAGTPSADTFRRVFEALDPTAFERCFRGFIAELAKPFAGEVIAIDGKSVRGAIDKAGSTTPMHLVHVWATEQRLLLSQRAVSGAYAEVSAALEMLQFLDVEGATITLDANGCTAKMTTAIREKKAHYVLALKANRGAQYRFAVDQFAALEKRRYAGVPTYRTSEDAHGRHEERTVRVLEPAADAWPIPKRDDWTERRTLVLIDRLRVVNGKRSVETHYYVSSHAPDPKQLAQAIRAHWSVENHLHWQLDVTWGEDRRLIRDRTGAQNFALVSRLALMMLRNEKTDRHGAPTKRLRAGWDPDYLLRVLTAGIAPA